MSRYWSVNHVWTIPPHTPEHLDHYYLLHWEPKYFLKQLDIREGKLYLTHQDQIYAVKFYATNLTEFLLDPQILLSFRMHKNEPIGIVLIRRIHKS